MRIRTAVAGTVSILAAVLVSPGHSANLAVGPSLETVGTYDSNIFAAQDNVVGDFFVRVTPRLALDLEMNDGTIEIAGGIDSVWYKDNPDFSNATASKFVDLTTPVPIRLTSSLSIDPFARYLDTHHPYRRMELQPAPTAGQPPTEIFVAPQTHQRVGMAGLQTTYAFSQRSDVELGGSWNRIEFPDNEAGLVGSKTWRGNMSLLYKASPRVTPGVYGSVRDTDIDDGTNELAYTGGLRGSYLPSPGYVLDGRVGMTWQRTSASASQAREWEQSPEAILTLTYTKMYFHAALQGSYIFEAGGIFGTPARRASVYVSVGDRLSEKWSWDFIAYYQKSTSTDSPRTIDLYAVDGTSTISFDPYEWMRFFLSGNLHRQVSSGRVGTDIDRYRVLLGVTLHTIKRIL